MSDAFTRLVGEIYKTAPGVKGLARDAWGSRTPGSREALRQSIADSLTSLDTSDLKTLADLSEPPRLSNWSVSISHTHDLGGWMAVPRAAQVGWDVELEARIKPHIIERVCTQDELDLAPERAFLWCAKEAFFKALEDEQPETIPQLTIGDWNAVDVSMWRWSGIGPRNGEGILIRENGRLYAASIIP